MSLTQESSPLAGSPAEAPAAPAPPGAGRAGDLIRRWRWPLSVAAIIVIAVALVALVVPAASDARRLSPGNPAPDGSRALAQVLRGQGVEVVTADRSDEATAATTPGSTLVVTDTSLLAPEQLNRLAADDASRLILVEPDELTLSALAPQVRTAGYSNRVASRSPGCSVEAAVTAGDVRGGGHLYARSGGAVSGGVSICYPQSDSDDNSDVDTGTERGSYLVTVANNRQVVVVGQSDLLTNGHLGENGNAALALNTFGAQSSLVWYLPDPLEQVGAGERATLGELMPDWVIWSLIQLTLVVLVAMAWRARRFGRLVGEPLPVVVRAAETLEGRARLYRQFRARGRAASTLRTSALRRLATRLAVPAGTTPQQVVVQVAAATGRHPDEVGRVLLGPAPDSDAALVELADRLDELERAAGVSRARSGGRAAT
ncbi:DUF4350 domain-containing protein [Kineosporia sp. J2-2]|uniref:DUF4350 domain-containing protein n=1 Tax=Kineosporia corallincola TaxID=2835133 RepID=A0ABS5TH00_9ACTN|nr:DUF4350 domain-containing protein [Kineosporia corallincola]MBT0770320.1 DUF4350 domain-containing protein [Kineosporia corallincola]